MEPGGVRSWKGVGAHLIVVQCRIIAEGTDGCELHKPIKLPTAHRLLPLSPAESERSAQDLAPPLSDGLHWPRPQETTPKGPFGSPAHLTPPPHSGTLTLRPLGCTWYPKW